MLKKNKEIKSPHPRAFHVMTKPHGPICNLNCGYCYYLPKTALYPGSDFRMSDAVLESFTRQYIEAQQVPEVVFGWQGGEPLLMGQEFFARAIALQEKYRRPGMRILNTIQTNGVLINDDWAEFLHKHNFLVGLSLDGPRAMHDAYRVDKDGHPTWERVMRGLERLQQHHVELNILCTVHRANAPHPLEVYRFLRDVATDGGDMVGFIQFIPIVRRDNATGNQEGSAVTSHSVTGEAYGEFLTGVFDEWVRHDVGRVFVQIFDVALAAWMGERPGLCVFEATCGLGLALEHNGDLYACDHFVEPHYQLGNIMETPLVEMAASERQRQFGEAKRETLNPACLECTVRFVCNGGCPKNRILDTKPGEPPLNTLCAGYRAFFEHIRHPMQMMTEELHQHHPPANVMAKLIEEDREREQQFRIAGRNDPCPCGSGKKFKHCHGRLSLSSQ
ncbi:MAG: anaerobic sulfatase maturase [Anaerolineae bacterium]|nr:anaerobic sulfatase maturase [Anaerolineae bacterium]